MMKTTTSTIGKNSASMILRLILSLLLPITLRSFTIQPLLLQQCPSRLQTHLPLLRRVEKRYNSRSKTYSSSTSHPLPRTTVQSLLMPRERHYLSNLSFERRPPCHSRRHHGSSSPFATTTTTTSLQSTLEKPLTTTPFVEQPTNNDLPSDNDTTFSPPSQQSSPTPENNKSTTQLPPPQTDVQNEFRSMIDSFSSYTPHDISLISNIRYRALFDCVAAVANEPDVYVAFLILFEDVYPLRVAGRMIYGHLTSVMKEAQNGNGNDNDGGVVVQSSSTSLADGVGIVDPRLMITGDDDDIDNDKNNNHHRIFDEKEERNKERFDQMVKTFKEWEDGVLLHRDQRRQQRRRRGRRRKGGDGDRMEHVLRGCFVGARNPQVVEALRIVYIDFPTLRFAGDLIFKLMSKLMGS